MPGPLGGIIDAGGPDLQSEAISPKKRPRSENALEAAVISSENGFSSLDMMADGSDGVSEERIRQCELDSTGNGCAPLKNEEDALVEAPRKRMKVTSQTPLRRSARRLAAVSAIADRVVKRERKSSEKKRSPVEVKDDMKILPPSSTDLELENLPVLDVFSVYSFLRSFSFLLFLSPFSLKAFVAALKCKNADSLTDAVHFSILQTLKPHLEALSEEGSEFATNCLRNLNWELLDPTNWPLYVAEYLLICDPKMCSGLKLLNEEYYVLPGATKLEILRRLCDDVVEAETIRKDVNKRIAEFEKNVEAGQSPSSMIKGNVDSMDMSDGNSDWCCLCGMEGSLICCDGCPAAFHSRCVGIAGDLLPEGEWFCPECMVRKFDGNVKIFRSLEGAEILGFDRCNRIYFASCGYLLVSEPANSNSLSHYYNSNDVHVVVQLLRSSCPSHAQLASSITSHWAIDQMNVGETALKCTITVEELNTVEEQHANSSFNGIIASETSENSKTFLPIQEITKDICSADNTIHHPKKENEEDFPDLDNKFKEAIPSPFQDLNDYVNWYSFGRFTSSVAESINKSPVGIKKLHTLTVDDIISSQLREIYKKSLNQYWSVVQGLPSNAQKEACGWCFACRNDYEHECLLRVIETKILAGSRNRAQNFHAKDSRKSHIFSLAHLVLHIEDSLHGLLSGPWHNPSHRKQWRRNVMKSVDLTSLKHQILALELHLRRVALSSDWIKPLDSTLTVGSGSHILPRPMPIYPRQGGGKKATRKNNSDSKRIPDLEFYYFSSIKSKTDAYYWRGGRLSRQVFNWNMLPRSLASKGGRQAGCKRIPGILYIEGSEFARRSRYIAWRASVEMSHNVSQLMYQIKDLDSNIRWNDLSSSHPLPKLGKDFRKSSKPWKAAICQKREDEGHLSYLLHFGKKKSIPDVVIKHGVLQEDTSEEEKKYWLDESYVPISLFKAYEAKKLDKKQKKTSNEGVQEKEKCDIRKPKQKKGLSYLISRAHNSDQFLCRHCGKCVQQREDAVTCQLCKGPIHKKHFRLPEGASSTTYICLKCHKNKLTANQKPRTPDLKKGKVKKIMKKYKKVSHDRKNQELAGEFREKKPKSKSKLKKRKPAKCKILVLRKSERLATKKNKLSHKNKKKKPGLKKVNNKLQKGINRRVLAPKISKKVTEWEKRQRSFIQPPFWLNGLMWTRKSVDDRAVHFRERHILLPASSSDTRIKPLCSLCHQEYNSCLIYISCENCGDWFHGDVFALNLGNINNVRGFKCHGCRIQSMPMCPYLNQLDESLDFTVNIGVSS